MRASLLLFLSFLLPLIGSAAAAAQTGEWKPVPAVPAGKGFTAVTSPSPSHFIAVGNHGRIARSTDGGLTWSDVPSGLADEFASNLTDLSFGSPLTGAAVGFSGNIVQTTDGGASWFQGDVGVDGYLSSLFFLDENFGVATGPFFLKTRDGGKSWEQRIFSLEGSMQDVVLLDTLRGIAVGPAGFAGSGTIFTTENGGMTWDYLSVEGVGFRQFHQIAFADPQHGLIVGSGGTIIRTEDGASWSLVETGVAAELTGVAMRDPMNAITVGWEGTILRTTDGGRTWRQEASPTSAPLLGVGFDENGTAIIVGGEENGIILRFEEGPSGIANEAERNGSDREEGILAVAPNPAVDRVRIEWRREQREAFRENAGAIVICDLLGKEVARFSAQENVGAIVWNAARIPAGAYIVRMIDGKRETGDCRFLIVE